MTVPRIMGVIRSRIRGFAVTHQQGVDWEGHASGVNDVPGLDTGAPGGNRTPNLPGRNRLLYPLSYGRSY